MRLAGYWVRDRIVLKSQNCARYSVCSFFGLRGRGGKLLNTPNSFNINKTKKRFLSAGYGFKNATFQTINSIFYRRETVTTQSERVRVPDGGGSVTRARCRPKYDFRACTKGARTTRRAFDRKRHIARGKAFECLPLPRRAFAVGSVNGNSVG